MGIGDNQHFRVRPGLFRRGQKVFKKISVRPDGNASQVSSGNDHGIRVDRVGGIRRKDHIPRTDGRENEVRKPFFRSYGDDGFVFRIDRYVETPFIPVGNGMAQFGDAHGGGVSVIMPFLYSLDQFVNNMSGRGDIGIAHPQVNNIFTPVPCVHFDLIDRCEDIRRQAGHSPEFLHLMNLLENVFQGRRIWNKPLLGKNIIFYSKEEYKSKHKSGQPRYFCSANKTM